MDIKLILNLEFRVIHIYTIYHLFSFKFKKKNSDYYSLLIAV
jgi:hypothetical protein